MNASPVQPGDILAQKYRVEHILGMGNMGVVVAATHIALGQLIALKFMLPGKVADQVQRERFLREARAAVRLKSQHVARVLDVGTLENEAPYIVMEFLEGQDLAAVLKARGYLPFDEAVEYVLQTCEAVGEAHAMGIVHRDLKPANLFLTKDVSGAPCVKVVDFGISKLSGAELTLTHEAQALGSPLYMSPEQMNSAKSADARADLWALGVILYQLVTGWTPFHAETIQELCTRVLFGQPTPLGEYRSDPPPGFEAVILRCLERDRDRRFRDVAELAAVIAPYAPMRAHMYPERVARVVGATAAASSTKIPAASPVAAHPRASPPSFPDASIAVTPRASQPSFPDAPPSVQSRVSHSSFPDVPRAAPSRPSHPSFPDVSHAAPPRPSQPSYPGVPVTTFPPTAPPSSVRPSYAPTFGLPPVPASTGLSYTDSAWGRTGAGGRPAPAPARGRAGAIAVIVLVLATLIAVVVWFGRRPPPVTSVAPEIGSNIAPAVEPLPLPAAPVVAAEVVPSTPPASSGPAPQQSASAAKSASTRPPTGGTASPLKASSPAKSDTTGSKSKQNQLDRWE